MPGKQDDQPPWARRHAWIVALIGAFAVALATGAANRDVAVAWLVVPAASLAAPALVSALPYRGRTAVAAASSAALVTQTVFAIVVLGTAIHPTVAVVAVLAIVAMYESGVVLAGASVALIVASGVIALIEPSLLGLSTDPKERVTTLLSVAIAILVTGVAGTIIWRDRRRSTHIANQQRLATEAYLDVAGTLMLVLNRDGEVTVANRQTCLTLDLEEQEILGREWFELALPDEYRDDARRMFRLTFDHFREYGELIRSPQDYENEVFTRDRSRRQIAWWATFITDVSGDPVAMVCSGTDLTDARVTAAALERNRLEIDALRRLAQKVASLNDSRQAVVDAALDLTDATLVAIMQPDRTRSKLVASVCTSDILSDYQLELGREASVLGTAFLSGQPQFIGEVIGTPGINERLAEAMGAVSAIHQPITGVDGIMGVLTVVWDHHVPSLQERKAELVGLVAHEASIALRRRESLAQLERAALIDPLTGISNRRAFDAELPLALRRAGDGNYPLALVMIDLNEFKAVNDLLGHEAGDHVLINTSTAWADALRAGDLLARLGGDEFAVLLPTCDELEMAHIIQRLHRATPHGPGASIGGALWDGCETASSLIRRADRSQYADKARCKDSQIARGHGPTSTGSPRPRVEDPRKEAAPEDSA